MPELIFLWVIVPVVTGILSGIALAEFRERKQ